jgi:DDE superfamily endonuclease
MPPLPEAILLVLAPFAPLFSQRVWVHAQVLLLGAILAPGPRTVTAALRIMGLALERRFTNYHRVLNRATWSARQGSRMLLGLLLTVLVPQGATIVFGADDTVERRSGRKIKAKGCYRDAVRSTKKHVIRCFGLKWVSMMLLVPVPWSRRVWALPFLTALCWPKQKRSTRRHKTSVDWVRQMMKQVRRWLPGRRLVLVVDGGFAAVSLALACVKSRVTMVSRLRWDAALYHPPGPQPKGKRGPQPTKGKRQRRLQGWAERSDTPWETVEVRWYGGQRKKLWVFSRTALWYTPGLSPVEIRYVLVADPEGQLRMEAFFCTDLQATPEQILEWVVMRWSLEVTFEESRAHLGLETQRQWSDQAIARTTPILLALFSLVTVLALQLSGDGQIPVPVTAWYHKGAATFSDCLALVRRHLWRARYSVNSTPQVEFMQLPQAALDLLIHSVPLAA